MGQSWEGWGISDALVSPVTWKRIADVERRPDMPTQPPRLSANVRDYFSNVLDRAISALAIRQPP